MDIATKGVHAGRGEFGELGVHAAPLDLSTTYPFDNISVAVDSFDKLASGIGDAPNNVYSRLSNPTVRRFETALAAMENAEDAVAFSSGMAAISAVILAATQHLKHIVAVRPIYGSTDHLLESGLLGTTVTWTTADNIADCIRDDTAMVFIETPANPTLDLVDIESVVSQAAGVPVVVDSTFATPILQRPLELGASIVIHSATKFIGGHGDVLGGVIATGHQWAEKIRKVRIVTGGNMHPLSGYLLHRGLQTLQIRVLQAQRNAREFAARLATHPCVDIVYYPLFSSRYQELAVRQMSGPGTVLSFTLRDDVSSIGRILGHLQLITPAVSLGSVDTLIQHPFSLTHRLVSDDAKLTSGVCDNMLRLSVGIENVDDIWQDLAQAIAKEMPVLLEA